MQPVVVDGGRLAFSEVDGALHDALIDATRSLAPADAAGQRRLELSVEILAESARLKAGQHADWELLKRKNEQAQAEAQVAVEQGASRSAQRARARSGARRSGRGTRRAGQESCGGCRGHATHVQRDASQALGALSGKGTSVYLGDFSHAPALLFARGLNANIPLSSGSAALSH